MTIYALAMVFSFIALLMNYASNTAIILLIISTAFGIELFIELIGLVGENRQPLMCALKFLGNRRFRQEVLTKRTGDSLETTEEPIKEPTESKTPQRTSRRKRRARHKK